MKRIKYISRFTGPCRRRDLDEKIGRWQANNAASDVTGLLVVQGSAFFQVLEGPDERIDELYEAIAADSHHTDLLLLSAETRVPSRYFEGEPLRLLHLDDREDAGLSPLRSLMMIAVQQREILRALTVTMEETARLWIAKEPGGS